MADILKSTPYQNAFEVEKDLGSGSYAPLVAMIDAYNAPVSVTWTSGTAQNTTSVVNTAGYDSVVISLVASGTVSGGVITFELFDGAAWLPCKVFPMESYNSYQTYTLATGLNNGLQADVAGFPQFRCRLSTAITGAGSITVTQVVSSAPSVPGLVAGLDPNQPLPAGANNIGFITTYFGWTDTAVALGSSATFTGTGEPITTTATPLNYFNAFAFADQAGTLFIDRSQDGGSTWRQAATVAVTANAGVTLSTRICGAASGSVQYRARYVNGAVAQTIFNLSTSYTAN